MARLVPTDRHALTRTQPPSLHHPFKKKAPDSAAPRRFWHRSYFRAATRAWQVHPGACIRLRFICLSSDEKKRPTEPAKALVWVCGFDTAWAVLDTRKGKRSGSDLAIRWSLWSPLVCQKHPQLVGSVLCSFGVECSAVPQLQTPSRVSQSCISIFCTDGPARFEFEPSVEFPSPLCCCC